MRHPILVVDSDAKAGAEVARLLEQAGYSSVVVNTVPAGLRILREEAPSLIITASRVDGYNGLQLIAMAPRPIPAIVLAAPADAVLAVEARQLGADLLVTPTAAELLALVAQKLAPAAMPEQSIELRRWARKRVIGQLAGRVDVARARIVDVSYGGVGFEIDDGGLPVAQRVRLVLPDSDLDIPIDVVWKRPAGSRWAYGAVVSPAQQHAWRRLVDAIA